MLRRRFWARDLWSLNPFAVVVVVLLVAAGSAAGPVPTKRSPSSNPFDSLGSTSIASESYQGTADDTAPFLPPTLSANETVLAFELISYGSPDSVEAQSTPSKARPTFFIAYDNSTSELSTFDRVMPSLPDISSQQADSTVDSRARVSSYSSYDRSQRVPGSLRRSGNSTLTYRLFFPVDFDFRDDARLPSLFSGRSQCSSCFSTRVRYTEDGAGELYTYNSAGDLGGSDAVCSSPGSTCSSRESHIGRGAWTFVRNKWITVRHDVWVNQAGHTNGGFNIWIDGRLVLTAGAIRYTGASGVCSAPPDRPANNEILDSCLPAPRSRWRYEPAIRRERPRPAVTTRILLPTTVTAAPVTVTRAPVTVTQTEAVTIPVTRTAQVTMPAPAPVTETTTVTVTEAAPPDPSPANPPVEDEPVDDPAGDDSEDDEPVEEEAVRLRNGRLSARSPIDYAGLFGRDDGLWKGLNGYPGDPGFRGGAQPPAATGYPVTLTVQQVVTLYGPPTVTVTKTLSAGPTSKRKAPQKKKPA